MDKCIDCEKPVTSKNFTICNDCLATAADEQRDEDASINEGRARHEQMMSDRADERNGPEFD
jgi:hypothetical protein